MAASARYARSRWACSAASSSPGLRARSTSVFMGGGERRPSPVRDHGVSMAGLKGRLLVATPLLGDPNFERSVVFLLEHGEEGALGVVLNRPSELEVGEPLPEWRRFTGTPEVVFVGG